MKRRTKQPSDSEPQRPVVRLTAAGRDGGLQEFIHALAAILARLDAEQQRRVQSEAPQQAATGRKESE